MAQGGTGFGGAGHSASMMASNSARTCESPMSGSTSGSALVGDANRSASSMMASMVTTGPAG